MMGWLRRTCSLIGTVVIVGPSISMMPETGASRPDSASAKRTSSVPENWATAMAQLARRTVASETLWVGDMAAVNLFCRSLFECGWYEDVTFDGKLTGSPWPSCD